MLTVLGHRAVVALLAWLVSSAVVVAADHYVRVGGPAGDGGKARPFNSLGQAQEASTEGDTIYLLPPANPAQLAEGIALKPFQKLIGLDESGRRPIAEKTQVVLSGPLAGQDAIVRPALGVEISGIHFTNIRRRAIGGADGDFSGMRVHDNLFTGSAKSELPIYAIDLEVLGGAISAVDIYGNVFRDGDDLGAIRLLHKGNSVGAYRFRLNRFDGIGGRAYHIQTMDTARLRTEILDSKADNIGVGNRNSDSIIPFLMGRSQQTMIVRGYHYDNSRQVGNESNTGLESFLFGFPREDLGNWCVACRLDLTIEDSVFDNSVTDGIQLTNAGSNSVVNVTIRRVKVRNAKPKQTLGSIGMTGQRGPGRGSRNTILIEDSDLIGSSGFGFSVKDETSEPTIVMDLGGGPLGSRGGNRILQTDQGAIRANPMSTIWAQNNWFGGPEPKIGGAGQVVVQPALRADPRP